MKQMKLLLCFLLCAAAYAQEDQKLLFSVLPLIENGRLSEAEAQLRPYQDSAILQNALGIVYLKQNKTGSAISAFQRALKLLPSFTAAQLHLASIYQQQNERTKAADLFAAAGDGTSDFDALVTAGLGLAQCEDYPRAIRVMEKAYAIRPESASVTYNLALARYKNGELKPALEAVNLLPEGADVLYLRGKIKHALGRADGAADLAHACAKEPTSEEFCVQAGLRLIQQEQFVDAARILQSALQKQLTSVRLLSLLGLTHFRLGAYRNAIESYTRALEQEPGSDASREGLAFLLYVTGDLEKARSVLEQGLGNPACDFYLSQLHAMVLYRLSPQLWPEALKAIDRALSGNPRFAPSYFLRGKIEMERNHLSEALADFSKAMELDPKYPLPYYKAAQIYSRTGRLREAEIAQNKFSQLGSLREEELLTKETQQFLMPADR